MKRLTITLLTLLMSMGAWAKEKQSKRELEEWRYEKDKK